MEITENTNIKPKYINLFNLLSSFLATGLCFYFINTLSSIRYVSDYFTPTYSSYASTAFYILGFPYFLYVKLIAFLGESISLLLLFTGPLSYFIFSLAVYFCLFSIYVYAIKNKIFTKFWFFVPQTLILFFLSILLLHVYFFKQDAVKESLEIDRKIELVKSGQLDGVEAFGSSTIPSLKKWADDIQKEKSGQNNYVQYDSSLLKELYNKSVSGLKNCKDESLYKDCYKSVMVENFYAHAAINSFDIKAIVSPCGTLSTLPNKKDCFYQFFKAALLNRYNGYPGLETSESFCSMVSDFIPDKASCIKESSAELNNL
jgi:hypothetical protein